MNKKNDNNYSNANSALCNELMIDCAIFTNFSSILIKVVPHCKQPTLSKVQTLFPYTKTFVINKVLLFLAICFILSGCGGAVNRPVVFVDAEEYTADGIQAYTNAEWHKAQRFFNKALQLYQGVDDQEGALLSYINLAEVSLNLHDYSQTNLYLSNAEAIATYQAFQKYSARISLLYGLSALQQNQLTEAEHILQEILPAFDESTLLSMPNTTQLAVISSMTKIAFLNKHDEVLWTKRYASALKKIANESTDREARLLRYQSDLLLQQEADRKAESKKLQALALYKSKQSREGIAATLLELAQYYRSKQQWQVAFVYFNRSKSVYQFLGDVEKVKLIDGFIIQIQSNIN